MPLRTLGSRLLLALGALLLAGALAQLAATWTRPAQGLEDLGRAVGALLLATAAGPALALGLLLARRASRTTALLAGLGCALAVLPSAGFLSAGIAGSPGLALFGTAALAASAAGLAAAWRHWRREAPGTERA